MSHRYSDLLWKMTEHVASCPRCRDLVLFRTHRRRIWLTNPYESDRESDPGCLRGRTLPGVRRAGWGGPPRLQALPRPAPAWMLRAVEDDEPVDLPLFRRAK